MTEPRDQDQQPPVGMTETKQDQADPRIHVDWGGEHVTFRIGTRNVEISLSCSLERAVSMISELQWATTEIERFVGHCAAGRPDYTFRQTPHPGDGS